MPRWLVNISIFVGIGLGAAIFAACATSGGEPRRGGSGIEHEAPAKSPPQPDYRIEDDYRPDMFA